MARRRAISDDDKRARQEVILEAAWALLQEHEYKAISMNDIAHQADLAKGTIYLYFATKEALFLHVEEQQLNAWFDVLDLALASLPIGSAVENVSRLVCTSLVERPAMLRLLTMLHPVLEQNIDLDDARRFKHFLRVHVIRTGALLERIFPFLTTGAGVQLMLQVYVLVLGFHQMADPPKATACLLDEPELALFNIDFTEAFSSTLEILLRGWQTQGGSI